MGGAQSLIAHIDEVVHCGAINVQVHSVSCIAHIEHLIHQGNELNATMIGVHLFDQLVECLDRVVGFAKPVGNWKH